MMNIVDQLLKKETSLAVIGLGYVGLPIALEFAQKVSVIGFDIDPHKIEALKNKKDPGGEMNASDFEAKDILFTSDKELLKRANIFLIAVPTPIDQHNYPNLGALKLATSLAGESISRGGYVIIESTVYPGVTEDECIPLLEDNSGLKYKDDFKVGYSPERINPGDKTHTLRNTAKVISACDDESLHQIEKLYQLVVDVKLHKASSIKVAEAAKIIENTQRDVNIALMNELSILFGRMGINTYDVLEAAGTKWNFLNFQPGLVGGHCIGVDPYYLTHKARELKYHPKMINSGRFVNDSMGGYIAKQLVKKLLANKCSPLEAQVLVMGASFKENVSDIRNSKVFDIVNELKTYGIQCDLTDPIADPDQVKNEYNIQMVDFPDYKSDKKYHAIILAVAHDAFKKLHFKQFEEICFDNPVFFDLKGIFRKEAKNCLYWSL